MSNCGVIHNGFVLFLLGLRIEMYNRALLRVFRTGRLLFLCRILDKRLQKLRKEFALLEERHRVMTVI